MGAWLGLLLCLGWGYIFGTGGKGVKGGLVVRKMELDGKSKMVGWIRVIDIRSRD